MGQWFITIGGQAWAELDYDYRGRQKTNNFVKYGRAKASYTTKDGTGLTLVRFAGEDASIASVFLIKFINDIVGHNFEDYLNYE